MKYLGINLETVKTFKKILKYCLFKHAFQPEETLQLSNTFERFLQIMRSVVSVNKYFEITKICVQWVPYLVILFKKMLNKPARWHK